ncbi:MAG: alpha-2-macroglobulin family protein, partial [Rufibacter sp.]
YAEASQQYYWYTRSAKNDDDEENTILFTDRQIYRPGQTLYFKGIQVRKAKGKSELVTNEEIEVELYDANDKILGTLDLTTNKYGSFSGSFQIPASIVTGELTLETLDGEIEVSVEEYKRPSFQVAFSPIKEIYRLNDSVQAKGQVKAFSGYELSGAKVQYKIVRESVYSSDYPRKNRSRSYRTETLELASGTATTDVNGDFDITFKALAEVIPEYQGQQYVYEVTATVTDASGETQEEEVRVRVGQKVLDLELSLPSRILLPDSLNTVIWLTNLNQQLQAGSVTVEVFSLKSPGRLYKNRLWEEPDLSAFTTSEFEKVFPSYAPPGLSTYQNWPVKEKIYSQTLISTAQRPALLKAAFSSKVTPGLYLVQVTGVTQTGDTVSTRRHVSFVSDKNHQPVQMSDWVIPVKEKADVGEKAEFLVGAGNGTVLVEVYNGPELISSEWVNTGTNQMKMQVPIKPSFGNNVQVQFLMVKDNRLYKSQHKISQNRSEPTLALRFSTFRNKLVPGQKESWKLQITNLQNKAKAAEMVASLYDASLDKISRPQDWYSAFSQAISTYTPDYFSWGRGQFVSTVVSQSLQERPAFNPVFTREYERLHFFGYRYFGGYNHGYREFLKRVEQRKATEKADQALEETYKENAAQVKNGVEVAGQIIDNRSKEPLTGVTISLKGTNIVTFSNSKGYFKMRVPVPGKLEFNFIGYDAQVLSITKAGNVTIALEGDAQTLNEVVVVGYGVQERRELTGSVSTVTTIRGVSSLPDSNQLAGVAPGIKIDRTKATVSGKTAEVPITIRKNFQETAFFFPHLLTDAKGNITLEFTVPEALTRWQFKGFAHTRQLEWGLLEGQVMTQKQLMVSPYMPRFLREGDTLTVSARIANLSVDNLSGKVTLQFFNALTNQPIEILQNSATAEQDFKVAAASTTPVFFNLIVPGKVEALTYRITAQTKGHADGEENTLPVLPNSILVTETMPMLVRPGQTKSFTLEKLVQPKSTTLQSQTLTLEYIQNPVWSAVQALPYLMEYPYECAEQTFSRIYANSVAAHIVEKTPAIQKVFQLWKASTSQEVLSNLERNPGLKQTLLAETPWLKDAVSQTEQKKRIALLFDLNKMENELTANLEKLEGMQYGNGSFPWFVGMPPNRYITQHILAGIGQLEKLGVISASNSNFKAIKTKGVSYLNSVILEDKKYLASFVKNKSHLYPDQIHAWYARSYFTATPLSAELQNLWQTYQNLAAADWQYQSLYEQGLIALTMLRYGQSDLAQKIIKSLLERSQQSEELGLFWPQNRSGYFWYQAPVETQVLFIELFTEANADAKYLSEMKLWLLRHKQTNHWRTTKATAAACYALLLRGEDWLSAPAASAQITVGGTPLETLAPDLPQTAGSGYLKTSWAKAEIAPQLGNVQVKNTGSAPSWGALYWQYLEQTEKITASETQLKLKRQYFVQETTNARDILKPVSAANPPKVGDLVKVVIYLESDREFEYIHLKDLRPAGTEPVDALSGYQYQDGLYYYQSTTDASTNFFISRLGKGNYVFEYRLRVAHAGDFATGITTIQSMYAPEFNSHSEGGRITFGK